MYNIITNYQNPHPGEGPFYTDYLKDILANYEEVGLDKCNWEPIVYPDIAKHKDRLVSRFNREYAFSEIAQETATRWQHFLQCRLDEVLEHYNHAYKIFEVNDVDALGTGYKYTEGFIQDKKNDVTGKSKNDTDNTYYDTPRIDTTTQVINNPTEKTTDKNKGESENHETNHSEYTKTITKNDHMEHMIDELNNLSDKYKSIDNEFIREFKIMFIGIMEV